MSCDLALDVPAMELELNPVKQEAIGAAQSLALSCSGKGVSGMSPRKSEILDWGEEMLRCCVAFLPHRWRDAPPGLQSGRLFSFMSPVLSLPLFPDSTLPL